MIRPEDIPGFAEHLALVRAKQAREREMNFFNRARCIGGIKVRTMTVMDFAVLCGMGNPIIHGGDPTVEQVCMFLRVLQDPPPYVTKMSWLGGYMFGRKIRKLKISSQQLVKECKAYVRDILADSPAGTGRTVESSTSFIASWCSYMREKHSGCTEQEVLWMPLPKLFQYLRAALKKDDSSRAEMNKLVDDAFQKICDLLNSGVPVEDLTSGKHKVEWTSSRY